MTTNKMGMINGKEILNASAFKKLADGRCLEVYKSYEEPELYPVTKELDRLIMEKGGCLFEPVVDDTAEMKSLIKFGSDVESQAEAKPVTQLWRANVYHFVCPQTKIGLKVIKPFVAKFWKHVFTNMFKVIEDNRSKMSDSWSETLQRYETM